ncbi:MAG TPA: 2,4-dienoyl-CoA reductase [Anaerolineae bacterium]|nr:2,4-dienoyl-CoA reductase [Anaerolineae bacterium]HRR08847.1 SDR family oxidoreductase [Rhodothermales bacterium]
MVKELFSPDALTGKHILITGGGTGLGRSMALRCAKLGAKVTICGRRPEPLMETVADIQALGANANGISCNIREAESVAEMVASAESQLGPVNGLVNNAAGNFLAPTHEISPNAFDSVVKTNLYGAFFITQALAKKWIERNQSASVVSITTSYAQTGSAFVIPSAVSKAGIEAMTKSLAVEWGVYNIRLNAIQPGPFPTEGAWKRLVPNEQVAEQMRSRVALGRFGEHDELTALVVFLLSDASSYMTGTVLTLDGGEVLNAGGQFNELTRLPRPFLLEMLKSMRG